MLTSLTVPVLALLVSIPGLGSLPGFRPRAARAPAVADTLPPAWKPASRLALENHMVFAALEARTPAPGIRLGADPRSVRVSVDPESDAISIARELGDVPLGSGARHPLSQYSRDMTWQSFRRQWRERSRQSVNVLTPLASTSGPRTGLQFNLPSPLPKRVQSWLGPGGPALNISGSENIRLSGQSNWTNQQIGIQGQRPSLFPSLDMQQDLDIRLEGQLSDRVRVNLLQNSGVQIPLANRIAINYKGDEDDLIQALDLGNTNLALPGTQYVSYSGKNEGLFGVKLASKLGPLDFTVLASKQEGRSERASYAGGAAKQTQTLRDIDYVKGVYFLLYDPHGPAYEIPDTSIKIYLDDRNYIGDEVEKRGRALVDPGQIVTASGPDSARLGGGRVSARGVFAQLLPGADRDYEILQNVYGPFYKVIRLKRPVEGIDHVLAATYERRPANAPPGTPFEKVGGIDTLDVDGVPARTLKLLWVHSSHMKSGTSVDRFDTTLAVTRVRDLELRNFYQLPGQRIDPATLRIDIRRGPDQPYQYTVAAPAGLGGVAAGVPVPYLEVLGLDNYDESSGNGVLGHDARIDATPVTNASRVFVDYEYGTLFFYDPRPFAPRIGPGGTPFESARGAELNRRVRLVDIPGGSNPAVYDKYNVQRDTDALYFIDVEFTAQRATGEITLGRSNLVENSEVVTINGQALVRDRDYTVDYDLGRITLKRQLGAADNLNIDYAYAPLFAQAGKTLLGSAFRYEGRDRSFGGAFMYESKGAQDLRPRLGEEPSRSLIGDLNSDLTLRPDWLTRMIDALPGVRTTAPSELRIQAEVGASIPNPNTRNEVYIDDMEGVRDAVSLSMTAERWRLSSVPSTGQWNPIGSATNVRTLLQREQAGEPVHNAELKWYSPYSVVKEGDLKPNLEQAQGAQNSHPVLALSVPRFPTSGGAGDSLWAGLTYVLDQQGLDLSKSQFIELWVNDFVDARLRNAGVRLHVDLGVVGEDQMRAPNVPPNNRLDTEDREPKDHQLVVDEDTGVDGAANARGEADSVVVPRDLIVAGPGDPEGDDYAKPDEQRKEIDPRRWRRTNGTEGNRLVLPYPDTEDLNLNLSLDQSENYFEWIIDLGDANHPYLVTDVQRDFAPRPGVPPPRNPVARDNGWRRYRIPIGDAARLQFGVPDLAIARHVRVWIDRLRDVDPPPDPATDLQRPLLMLGGIDIVGSRWRLVDLDASSQAAATTATLNSVNSVDNAEVYVAPFDPGETRSGSQGLTRREQSIALEFEELAARDTIEAFRSFSIDENYSRYGTLDWFVTGFDVRDSLGLLGGDGLQYFVRFASDERGDSYYEYRAPVPRSTVPPNQGRPPIESLAWTEVKLDLSELSSMKLSIDPAALRSDTLHVRPRLPGSPDTLVIRGRPSFTRLRRVSFGLVNGSPGRLRSGQLWFNEMRAKNVAKDRGQAQRVTIAGQASNLLNYNFTWDGRGADFLSVGESRGSGNSTSNINFGSTFHLHRFFEATGILLPVTVGYGRNLSRPRFNAGDDVVRSGAQAEASETYAQTRALSASYNRNWGERSHPLLRYTLGGITASASYTDGDDHNPNTLGKRWTRVSNVSYRVSPRRLLSVPLPFTKTRLLPLPDQFYWNYDVTQSWSRTSDRIGLTGRVQERAPVAGRQARIRFGADTRPVESFSHHVEGVRDLMLAGSPRHLGFLHFGKMVTWGQTFNGRLGLNRGVWLNPTINWSSRYNQDNGPQLSPDLSVRAINNGQSLNLGWALPFDRLAARPVGVVRDTGTAAKPPSLGWREWLSRLGNVQTDATINWGSSYTRLKGTPSLLYLVGLSQEPGPQGMYGPVVPDFNNVSNRNFDWRAGLRTRLALVLGAAIQTSADFSSRRGEVNAVQSRQDQARFPDLQIEYGQVANAVGLARLLQNPRLRTTYNNSKTTEFTLERVSSRSYSSQWQPMLGLNGELKNGTRIELQVDRRVTKSERYQLGTSVTTDRNTDVSFNVNRSYSQGQKVSLLGRESTVRSSVNLGFSAKYERQTGETFQENDPRPRSPVQRDRLSANATGQYGFSNNVTGNVSLGYGQDRDLQRDIVRRNVRVELRAAFTF